MFKTERIILKKAKKTPKKNNNIKNKLLFKTQEYYPRCLNPRLNHDSYLPNLAISGRWKFKEHIQFLEGLDKYGVNWKKIRSLIKTRTLGQIRSHAQKFFMKLKKVKDEQLGIDFTSDNINSIVDMINNIKSINSDYDIIKVFLYLSEKYFVMKKGKKSVKLKKKPNIEIDKSSNSDNNKKKENDFNNNDIIINNANQDKNISNGNNVFNNNMPIFNNNFMNNNIIYNYYNNNIFFMNNINIISNANIFDNFSYNIMIQGGLLNKLTPFNNQIRNSNCNDYNIVEKNL
jgi:SHAQKYF class myb-like DNA-binding protein